MGDGLQEDYELERFTEAQDRVYEQVTRELRGGSKRSHWMWFIFPQIAGLGHSSMAQRYAISCLDEAVAYLRHPVLGDRLRECTRLVNAIVGRTASEIFGYPDDLKFRSSMTLFARATEDNGDFRQALTKYFGGQEDAVTVARI
jgi:uncharacterized protein (DUF1810 family)